MSKEPGHQDSFPIICPHCGSVLSKEEIRSMLGQFARASRLSSLGASRFSKMTKEEKSAEQRRVSKIRWTKQREQQ
jgi:hypothetical protein